jgi:fatty acid desaturase
MHDMGTRIMRWEDGWLPNALALAYGLGGYALGLWACAAPAWWLNVLGVLLAAHALVIAAYLIHECAHNTIFADNRWNAALGEVLMWFTGAGYSRYEDIRHKHFRHHIDRADVVAFDFRPLLARHPKSLRLIQALEWAYVPAVDLMMHALVIVVPFRLASRHDRRTRVLIVMTTRLLFFAALGYASLKALLLYVPAYLMFLHMMRFFDVHQHTYEVWETLERPRDPGDARFDRDYEHRNTFSNLLSTRHPWLNLLALNFPYHNAHHVKPTTPWYRLPALHRELFGDDRRQIFQFARLLRSYHRYRVARVLNGDAPDMDVGDGRDFVGVVGVSFLTAH